MRRALDSCDLAKGFGLISRVWTYLRKTTLNICVFYCRVLYGVQESRNCKISHKRMPKERPETRWRKLLEALGKPF